MGKKKNGYNKENGQNTEQEDSELKRNANVQG